jgi:hypothetical protein
MPSSPYSRTSSARIPQGTRLNGIYEIDQAIGAGGMGEIYKGHNIQTGDLVAIKLMLPELAENGAAMALFRKEASALHSLHHEAIVRYYVFTVEPVLQRPYLAMEFVEGQSLSELLTRGPLTFEAMHALKQRLATGLQAAHERGVIHRDVSPDNIIIPGGDVSRAKIIDFGIARSTQMSDGTIIGGGFAGKYNYVSPEQLGLFGGNVTGKSDIYSLGLLLAEALTGQPIDMGGSQVDVIEKRRRVPDLGAIDLRVRPLIEQMLQPDPAKRPDSMADVAAWQVGVERPADLRQPYAARQVHSGRAPPPAARAGGRGRTAAFAAGIALLLLAGGGAGYYYLTQPDALAPPPGPVEKITRYINEYQGGDCFFIVPVAVSANTAKIEGYGASIDPFSTLDEAFKRANRFEADIGVRTVTKAQCPAITFLSRIRKDQGPAPRVQIGAGTLKSGQPLTGTVEGFGDRHVELLLVSDGGWVENVSSRLGRAGDGKTFNIPLQRIGAPGPQPQLLIVVASVRPLDTLRPRGAVEADLFFPLVVGEAVRAGQTLWASATYFKLDL